HGSFSCQEGSVFQQNRVQEQRAIMPRIAFAVALAFNLDGFLLGVDCHNAPNVAIRGSDSQSDRDNHVVSTAAVPFAAKEQFCPVGSVANVLEHGSFSCQGVSKILPLRRYEYGTNLTTGWSSADGVLRPCKVSVVTYPATVFPFTVTLAGMEKKVSAVML